jgi:hypothetical protein
MLQLSFNPLRLDPVVVDSYAKEVWDSVQVCPFAPFSSKHVISTRCLLQKIHILMPQSKYAIFSLMIMSEEFQNIINNTSHLVSYLELAQKTDIFSLWYFVMCILRFNNEFPFDDFFTSIVYGNSFGKPFLVLFELILYGILSCKKRNFLQTPNDTSSTQPTSSSFMPSSTSPDYVKKIMKIGDIYIDVLLKTLQGRNCIISNDWKKGFVWFVQYLFPVLPNFAWKLMKSMLFTLKSIDSGTLILATLIL